MRLLIAISLLAGCGDGLTDGTFPGDPLITLSGFIQDQTPLGSDDDDDTTARLPRSPIKVAIFWSQGGLSGAGSEVSGVEQQAIARSIFPAEFTLSIYSPPHPSVLFDAAGSGKLALGMLVAYADTDRDGLYDKNTDRVIGGARGSAVIYSPEGGSDPQYGPFDAGFTRVHFEVEGENCAAGGYELEKAEGELQIVLDATQPGAALHDSDCDGELEGAEHLCPEDGLESVCPGWTCGSPGTCGYSFCCGLSSKD